MELGRPRQSQWRYCCKWGRLGEVVCGTSCGIVAALGAYRGRLWSPWRRLGRILGRVVAVVGASEARAESHWIGRAESSTGVASGSPGRKLAQGRVGGEGPNPRQGSLVSAPRRNQDILRRAEEAHFLRTSHAKSPSRGTTTKLSDWGLIVL